MIGSKRKYQGQAGPKIVQNEVIDSIKSLFYFTYR